MHPAETVTRPHWVGCRAGLLAAEKNEMPKIYQNQREARVQLKSDALWLKICAEQKMRSGIVYRFASVVIAVVHNVIWSQWIIRQFTKPQFFFVGYIFALT